MGQLTNNQRKIYASLSTAKGRKEHDLFMAQGTKCVNDTLGHFSLEALIANDDWIKSHPEVGAELVKDSDLKSISTLTTHPSVIAIYRIPHTEKPDVSNTLSLALDGVQDPGNLGTIMRVCDWMGVRHIIASKDTVDVWSPKVVQATMGAISRVRVYYTSLHEYLEDQKDMPIYGTFLDGDDIYRSELTSTGIIVMGNEGNGIRPSTAADINRRLYIPPYPADASTSESLNVAVATAIALAEFRRRMY